MEILNILLGLVISLLGFPVGLGLAKIAKSELKDGRKYLVWMKNIILILSLIFVLYSFYMKSQIPSSSGYLHLILFLVIGVVLTLLIIKLNMKYYYGYIVLILLFLLSLKNINLLVLTSSMMFLYGVVSGGLLK